MDEKVNSHVHAYKRVRQAMVTLGADEDIMPEDIKVSKDIMEEVRWKKGGAGLVLEKQGG